MTTPNTARQYEIVYATVHSVGMSSMETINGEGERSSERSAHVIIGWGAKGIGFGELTIIECNGAFEINSECMSRRFVKAILERIVDSAETKDSDVKVLAMAVLEKVVDVADFTDERKTEE